MVHLPACLNPRVKDRLSAIVTALIIAVTLLVEPLATRLHVTLTAFDGKDRGFTTSAFSLVKGQTETNRAKRFALFYSSLNTSCSVRTTLFATLGAVFVLQ
eukprot:Lithocolla_globosa_v1_NODE_4171_length_1495_cov_11.565278.p3 type:complete len:101 gc:universal NODE_4171_length_1495_cov_11.565278:906-1208(+)